MSGVINQPKSTALLQPTKFQLVFNRMPDVQYFCKKVTLPGGSVPPVVQATPFKSRPAAGHKLDYETLTISWLLEEEMFSWEEIHNWLKDIGTETSFQDYVDLRRASKTTLTSKTPQYSDCTLNVLSTQNNPKIRFKFYECFPIRLGEIEFDTERSAEDVYTVEAEFGFFYYELERIAT